MRFRPNRLFPASLALLSLLLATTPQGQANSETKGDPPSLDFDVDLINRAPIRALTFTAEGTLTIKNEVEETITETREMDVHTIHLVDRTDRSALTAKEKGLLNGGGASSAQFYIEYNLGPVIAVPILKEASGEPKQIGPAPIQFNTSRMYFPVPPSGSQTLHFDPPIPLREGDVVGFDGGGNNDGIVQMTLHGFPRTDSAKGFVVR